MQRANTCKTGMIWILCNSECGKAQISLLLCVLYFWSSRYVPFVELIHLLNDVMFQLSTNQKPRKNLHTDGRHTDDGRMTDGRRTDRKVTYRARLPSLKIDSQGFWKAHSMGISKIHREIHQDIHRIQNKNEQIWPHL